MMTGQGEVGDGDGRVRWVGQPVRRKEDRRLVQGQGTYVDDIELPGMAHAAFARCPHPHARIVDIDPRRALAMAGVICVLTGEEVAELTDPFPVSVRPPFNQLRDYCMAVGTAKHSGEAVAAVVAETPYLAADAVEALDITYDVLAPVVDPEAALEAGAPLVHEALPSNEAWSDHFEYGDADRALAEADVVVEDDLHFHRFSSMPLETTAVIASYDVGTDVATVWSNNQRPMLNLPFIAPPLRMSSANIRFICPDIGGGFGIKNNSYPYLVALVLLARKAGRPVKWVESRPEHLLASTHGNEVRFHASIGMRQDGTILGIKARAVHDEGCYMRREPVGAINFIRHATVGYTFRNL
ncbi:MAG TPA: molybdopterin cofactor-binding domain-containing protein, partial [Acidimicrobiales bacterium]|nr:molybdopterin cofactor-binding domain-containing protein [Acidimicrobiales bacterium]